MSYHVRGIDLDQCAVVVLLVCRIGGRNCRPRAARILKERFARGEIDEDEFETRRRVLGE